MIVDKLNVQELPFVMFDDRKRLPSSPCIYVVISKESRVLYIGRSINTAQRWDSLHKYEALKQLDGVKIAYLEIDESLLHSVEKALIAWFKPPLNETDKRTPKGIEMLRRQKGLTQAQVAQALSVDVSTVRNWEKSREGKKMFERVAKLCNLLDCEPVDLYEEEQTAGEGGNNG